jgi:SAM-dependent methyltransferase
MTPLLGNLRDTPDRGAALASYARLAQVYDSTCVWVERLRAEALELLAAREGETVIDVACGTGAMLPALGRAVGPRGRVIGIEQSPEMAAVARQRIGLENVRIVVAPVEEAEIAASADAALFFYTHDVLQSDKAVERVLACVRPGARVVVAGARLLGWWAAPVNLWKLWRSRHYLSTYRGLRDPAARRARRCDEWRIVATHMLGTSYLASGTVAGAVDPNQAPALVRSRIAG